MINKTDPVDAWFLERHSRFTASENYKLLTTPKKREDYFSEGAWTYIEERAMQSVTDLWERPELDEVASLLWGKVYEYPAYERYVKETKNYNMRYLGLENPIFIKHPHLEDESGGTPDVADIQDDGSVNAIAEIKCPKNPIFHFRRLNWTTQWDIKEQYAQVYCQMQHLMMVTGSKESHFVSYDERQAFKSKKIKIIPVYTDQKFQDNLEIRLHQAVKEKYKILSNYLGSEVKCRSDLIKLK